MKAAGLTRCPGGAFPNRLCGAVGAALVSGRVGTAGRAFALVFGALGIFGQRREADWAVLLAAPQFGVRRAPILRKVRPLLFVWFQFSGLQNACKSIYAVALPGVGGRELSRRMVHKMPTTITAAIVSEEAMRLRPKPPTSCGLVRVSPSVAPRGRVST